MAWGRLKEGDQTATEAGGCKCHICSTFSLWSKNCLSSHPQLYPLLMWGGWMSTLQGAARQKEPRELQLISSSEGDSSTRGEGQQTQRLGQWSPQFLSLRRRGWCCIQFGPQHPEENEIRGRDKHFRTVHVRTTLENGSIPYKPRAKKAILKLGKFPQQNRELSQSSKEGLKMTFIVLHFSEQKMQKTNRREQQVYLQS